MIELEVVSGMISEGEFWISKSGLEMGFVCCFTLHVKKICGIGERTKHEVVIMIIMVISNPSYISPK